MQEMINVLPLVGVPTNVIGRVVVVAGCSMMDAIEPVPPSFLHRYIGMLVHAPS